MDLQQLIRRRLASGRSDPTSQALIVMALGGVGKNYFPKNPSQ
jgi:hypothetical protein